MITYCNTCKVNIDTDSPCKHHESTEMIRGSVLRKLRLYSNEVTKITSQLDAEELTEEEAEPMMIMADERFATRFMQMIETLVTNSDKDES